MDKEFSRYELILREAFGTDVLLSDNGDDVLDELPGFDSVVFVRLVVALEKTLGRELAEKEIESINSVSDLAQLLRM